MASQALTHAQKVTRLYRKSLKNLLSWTAHREVWREDACELREMFDENKSVDIAAANKLLERGEAVYERYKHPDPYIAPESPEGSKWERNLPPPPNALELLPEEKEWLEEWMKKAPK